MIAAVARFIGVLKNLLAVVLLIVPNGETILSLLSMFVSIVVGIFVICFVVNVANGAVIVYLSAAVVVVQVAEAVAITSFSYKQ